MTAPLRTDLNAFLFAPIASDANGNTLTVLTAMARTGVDPWEEAADLASSSADSATQRLIALLATVPNGPAAGEESMALAARLVALLHLSPKVKPTVDTAVDASARAAPSGETLVVQPKGNNMTIYYLIALIAMLIVQWVLTTGRSHIPLDATAVPASQTS